MRKSLMVHGQMMAHLLGDQGNKRRNIVAQLHVSHLSPVTMRFLSSAAFLRNRPEEVEKEDQLATSRFHLSVDRWRWAAVGRKNLKKPTAAADPLER